MLQRPHIPIPHFIRFSSDMMIFVVGIAQLVEHGLGELDHDRRAADDGIGIVPGRWRFFSVMAGTKPTLYSSRDGLGKIHG